MKRKKIILNRRELGIKSTAKLTNTHREEEKKLFEKKSGKSNREWKEVRIKGEEEEFILKEEFKREKQYRGCLHFKEVYKVNGQEKILIQFHDLLKFLS